MTCIYQKLERCLTIYAHKLEARIGKENINLSEIKNNGIHNIHKHRDNLQKVRERAEIIF